MRTYVGDTVIHQNVGVSLVELANQVFVESNRTEAWIETEPPKQAPAAPEKNGGAQ